MIILEWKKVNLDEKSVIKMKCPECNIWGYLDNHQIDKYGHVKPSVDCPTESCNFHEMIILKGYCD